MTLSGPTSPKAGLSPQGTRFARLEDAILDDAYPEVDLALRRGRHIDRDDPEWYAFLLDAEDHLAPLYRRFGCELMHRSDGYFYLLPTNDALGKRHLSSGEMLVGQALTLLYLEPKTLENGGAVTREEILGHLAGVIGIDPLVRAMNPKRKKYDERVAQETVRNKVTEALRRLAVLGFVEITPEDRVRLRPALMRFAEPVRGAKAPEDALARLVAEGEFTLAEEEPAGDGAEDEEGPEPREDAGDPEDPEDGIALCADAGDPEDPEDGVALRADAGEPARSVEARADKGEPAGYVGGRADWYAYAGDTAESLDEDAELRADLDEPAWITENPVASREDVDDGAAIDDDAMDAEPADFASEGDDAPDTTSSDHAGSDRAALGLESPPVAPEHGVQLPVAREPEASGHAASEGDASKEHASDAHDDAAGERTHEEPP